MKSGVQGPLAPSGNGAPPKLDYRPPEDGDLPVVHVDEHILMLSKPAGLLSVPGKGDHLQDCMESRARQRFASATTVHRLDRATSGIYVMALLPHAHRHLGRQFENRQVKKRYTAIVHGRLKDDEGLIELPLRTDWYNRPKQMVDTCLGRHAATRWRVVERLGSTTRVSLSPHTGRTHQLRVHMQEIGHPILGDEFYAPASVCYSADRLMLHAEKLSFRHPDGGHRVCFADPCPF